MIVGYAGLVILPVTTLWLGVSWYIGYVKLDQTLKYFQNSPVILNSVWLRNCGARNMLILVSTIATSVARPKHHLETGQLSQADLNNLPVSLRRKLIAMHWTHWGVIIGLIIFSLPFVLYEWASGK